MSEDTAKQYTCGCCKLVKSEYDFPKAQLRRKTPRCKSCCRDYQLLYKFGLTRREYDDMLAHQKGKCAICGSIDPGSKNKGQFSVDHDHVTGDIRGLLCTQCNTGLGSFQDNPEFLRMAISYLETVDHEVHRRSSEF